MLFSVSMSGKLAQSRSGGRGRRRSKIESFVVVPNFKHKPDLLHSWILAPSGRHRIRGPSRLRSPTTLQVYFPQDSINSHTDRSAARREDQVDATTTLPPRLYPSSSSGVGIWAYTRSNRLSTMVTATLQRPLRGARIQSFYPVKELPALSSLDSAFQLQEYISLLIRLDPHDVDRIVAVPGKKEREAAGDDADKDGRADIQVDEACWIYEQLRYVSVFRVSWSPKHQRTIQTTGPGPLASTYHCASARMHASNMS
jgi:hypothetical protein